MEMRRISRGRQRFGFLTFVQDPLRELPQVRQTTRMRLYIIY